MWDERTSPLDPSSPNQIWEKEKEREKEKIRFFRESVSNFSLDFLAIGPLNPGEPRDKVAAHGKSYALIPILWSFNNSGR